MQNKYSTLDRQNVSRLRQSIVRLRNEASLLVDLFLKEEPLLRGNVYALRRRCGNPGCGCATEGRLHTSMVLSVSEQGRTRLRKVPAGSLVEWKILSKRYQRLRQARARLVVINAKLFALLDELERVRRIQP